MDDEVVFRKDLKATDFTDQKVIIQHEDGTRCEFANAFFEEEILVKSNGYKLPILKVYSEHCGDIWFAVSDLVYFKIEKDIFPKTTFQAIKRMIEYWKSLHIWRYV
jgi:hypothetical protein